MCHDLPHLRPDIGHLNIGILFAVTLLHAIAFAAFLVKDHLLLAPAVFDDFGKNLSAFDHRLANFDLVLIFEHEHGVKFDALTRLRVQQGTRRMAFSEPCTEIL